MYSNRVGTNPTFDAEQIAGQLRGLIVSRFPEALANRAFSPVPFVSTIAREALPLATIAVVTGPDVTPLCADAAHRMLERR